MLWRVEACCDIHTHTQLPPHPVPFPAINDSSLAPLVAFLLNPERRHEMEWEMFASTPGMMQALSTCKGLRHEHRVRAEALRLDYEWWLHREWLAAERYEWRLEPRALRSPSSYSS